MSRDIGIVLHHDRPNAARLAARAAAWIVGRGHRPRVPIADAKAGGLEEWGVPDGEFPAGLDLAVSIGGDGTMLRTVQLVCGTDVPVLGVNVGRLGYLSEVEPDGLLDGLGRFLAGEYALEERMTLQVAVDAAGHAAAEHVALNEAVVEKTAPGHTVQLAVFLNDAHFHTYAADGLIVATPTGSTAYSLSARGPIASPRHRALLVTPVAAHTLFDRTLVLEPSDTVRVQVDGRPATLSTDGRSYSELADGDSIVCTAGQHSARLVTFGERNFHAILKTKFGLAGR